MIVQIRSDETSPRLEYVLKLVFTIHLGLKYQIIQSWAASAADSPILNYSDYPDSRADINLYSSGLLHQTGIDSSSPVLGDDRGLTTMFEIPGEVNPQFTFPFDCFSMVFYCLTRYEEYQDYVPDQYGRFSSGQSIAGLYGFIDLPIVDLWILELKKELETAASSTIVLDRKFSNVPTIDIDIPYAFKGKGVLNFGGLAKDLLSFNFKRLQQRWQYLLGGPDPFDTYSRMRQSFEDHHLSPHYYALMHYQKPLDENHLIDDPEFHSLLVALSIGSEMGLHPSTSSFGDSERWKVERSRLEEILGKPIRSSRQHYLMLSFPSTYRHLLDHGIEMDASMAFADRIGFRASTAIPFPWYDLTEEKITSLTIHPACIMDASMRWYMNMQVEDAVQIVKSYGMVVKKVEGQFSWIWHNSSFSPGHGWKSWSPVFEALCEC